MIHLAFTSPERGLGMRRGAFRVTLLHAVGQALHSESRRPRSGDRTITRRRPQIPLMLGRFNASRRAIVGPGERPRTANAERVFKEGVPAVVEGR